MPRPFLLGTALILALWPGSGQAAGVPSSPRSREVARRIGPTLEKALADKGLRLGAPVFLRLFKEPGQLELWMQKGERFELFRTYDICTFSGKLGPKQKEGDLQAPEGVYKVEPRQMNPTSQFHLSFDLGYPNAFDRSLKRTGSALMVHGSCVSIGCYAMGDEGIEEIWTIAAAALKAGQPAFTVHSFPFRMTAEKLEEHHDSPWLEFWQDLKLIHDRFEADGKPPQVTARRGRYVLARP